MSNLVKYTEGLSELEKSVITGYHGTRIANLEDNVIKNAITSSVTTALYNLGQSIKTLQERQILEAKILNDLKFYSKGLSTADIQTAFELGSKGEFKTKPDEVLFLSPEKVHSWIKAYKLQVKEPIMKKALLLESKSDDFKMSDEEIKKLNKRSKDMNIKNCVEAYDQFIQSSPIYDPVGCLYRFLNNNGLIKLTVKRRQEMYLEELSIHIESIRTNRYKRVSHRRLIEKYVAANGDINILIADEFRKLVELTCQQRAMKYTFSSIRELEMTMEEYIDLNLNTE